MPLDLYEKIIDDIANECPTTIVRPFGGGEPLLRSDMPYLIAYAKNRGLQHLGLNTNGTLLDSAMAIALLDAGLDQLTISIDAFSEDTYIKIKNKPGYELVIDNVNRYLDYRMSKRKHTTVHVSFVAQAANQHERSQFISYWSKRVDRVEVRELHQHGGLVGQEKPGSAYPGQGNRHPCPYLWKRLIIHPNGQVSFCENDWTGKRSVIGDVKTSSIKSIWNCPEYTRLRQSHVDGTFEHPFCKECPDWAVIKW
jgi:radical SAM protein with 4Fe4S-binding SPASM domain